MLLIVAALLEEVSGVLNLGRFDRLAAPDHCRLYHQSLGQDTKTDLRLLLTGTGEQRTDKALKWALPQLKPKNILSVGFSGGTQPILQTGDLILAICLRGITGNPYLWELERLTEKIHPSESLFRIARNAAENAGLDFEFGTMLNTPVIARTAKMKSWIGATLEAGSVDMESFTIGKHAKKHGIGFMSVRAVVDNVFEDLPEVVNHMNTNPVGGRLFPVIKYVLRKPKEIPRLIQLRRSVKTAQRNLTEFYFKFTEEFAEESQNYR